MKDLMTKGAALGTILALLVLSFSWVYAEAPKTAGPKVNINTASQAELEGLPGIGPKIAEQIVQFRTQNGNFKKIEEIMKVKGIGEKLFNQLKDLIAVSAEVK
ncbi:MAG: helix-hairpin-helix domain-containing protein [Candidatus Aminicenantes bacterium]|jgi:competence protein ComEA|nr:helix-hairpin-helix domain-containing protein [Candidatus Aminicenantes bacterium]